MPVKVTPQSATVTSLGNLAQLALWALFLVSLGLIELNEFWTSSSMNRGAVLCVSFVGLVALLMLVTTDISVTVDGGGVKIRRIFSTKFVPWSQVVRVKGEYLIPLSGGHALFGAGAKAGREPVAQVAPQTQHVNLCATSLITRKKKLIVVDEFCRFAHMCGVPCELPGEYIKNLEPWN